MEKPRQQTQTHAKDEDVVDGRKKQWNPKKKRVKENEKTWKTLRKNKLWLFHYAINFCFMH